VLALGADWSLALLGDLLRKDTRASRGWR